MLDAGPELRTVEERLRAAEEINRKLYKRVSLLEARLKSLEGLEERLIKLEKWYEYELHKNNGDGW